MEIVGRRFAPAAVVCWLGLHLVWFLPWQPMLVIQFHLDIWCVYIDTCRSILFNCSFSIHRLHLRVNNTEFYHLAIPTLLLSKHKKGKIIMLLIQTRHTICKFEAEFTLSIEKWTDRRLYYMKRWYMWLNVCQQCLNFAEIREFHCNFIHLSK